MSALRWKAEEISANPDIDAGMSDVGGKAEVLAHPSERPVLAEGVEQLGIGANFDVRY